jgi:hypothetical protein
MHDAAEIYGNQVRQMPSVERLRLATLILEELTIEQTEGHEKPKQFSALQILEQPNGGIFKTSEDVDEYLKAERESWDN